MPTPLYNNKNTTITSNRSTPHTWP